MATTSKYGVLSGDAFHRTDSVNGRLEGKIRNALDGHARIQQSIPSISRMVLLDDLSLGMYARAKFVVWDSASRKWLISESRSQELIYGAGTGYSPAGSYVMAAFVTGVGYINVSSMHLGVTDEIPIVPYGVYEVDLSRHSGSFVAMKIVGEEPWRDQWRKTTKDFVFTGPEVFVEDRFSAPIHTQCPLWVRYEGDTPTLGSIVGPVPGSTAVRMYPTFVTERDEDVEIVVTTEGAIPLDPDPYPYDYTSAYIISDDHVTYAFPEDSSEATTPPVNPPLFIGEYVPTGLGGNREWDYVDPETGLAIFERVWRYVKKCRNLPYRETCTYGWKVIVVDEPNKLVLIADGTSSLRPTHLGIGDSYAGDPLV